MRLPSQLQGRKYIIFILLYWHISTVFSSPWLTPSESWTSSANLAVKSDVALLANYGLITAPILTWPMSWANIGPALLTTNSKRRLLSLPVYVQQAYTRVVARYQQSIQQKLLPAAYLSGGYNINPFRIFDYQPRSEFQGGASLEKQGAHWAAKLAVDYGQYNDVTGNVHLDDSYLYWFLGNWGFGFDKMNNWWSPGYSDSLILSANPPPLAKFTIQRMHAVPFQTKWLSWIGPWSFTTSLSMGGPEVPEPHPLIWLLNLSIRPLESVQFSFSKNAVFAGDKRHPTARMFGNLITSDDNCDPAIYGQEYCAKNTPGNELWEITADWDWYKTWHIPANLYLQTIFNDRIPSDSYLWVYDAWHSVFPTLNPPIPARTSFLAGASSWFAVHDQLMRIYAEFEYTYQYAYYFWGEFESDIYGGGYPYVYYDKIIGSALGSETKGITLGGILNQTNGNSLSAMARFLQLNEYDFTQSVTYPFSKQDVLWLSITRYLLLPQALGQLSGQLGYVKSLRGAGLQSSPSVYITWVKNFT